MPSFADPDLIRERQQTQRDAGSAQSIGALIGVPGAGGTQLATATPPPAVDTGPGAPASAATAAFSADPGGYLLSHVQTRDRATLDTQTNDNFYLHRAALLTAAGQQWMDPQLTFALAQSHHSDADILGIAEGMRQVLAKSWDGFQSVYADPVLEKQPSALLAVKQYINQAVGPWPVEDGDLNHIQAQLQTKGFGGDLPANGVWSPAWAAAWKQWSNHVIDEQLAGHQPGGTVVGDALRNVLGSVLPKKAGNAIIGFVAGIPHDVRQVMADLASAAGGAMSVFNPAAYTDPAARDRPANVAGGFVEGKTPGEFAAEHQTIKQSAGRALNDVGTLLLLSDGLKLGSSASKAIGEGVVKAPGLGLAADLTRDEAAKGPGVIARSLSRGLTQRAVVGAGIGAGVQAARGETSPGQLLAGAGVGALAGAVVPNRAFENIPILGNTGPMVGRLADADGLYYRARAVLSSPYRLPAVRAAGDIVQSAGIYGAKVRGVAAAAGALDPNSPIAQSVQGEHVLDGVDAAVRKRLSLPIAGKRISVGLDDLMFLLHGPLGDAQAARWSQGAAPAATAYNKVGNDVQNVVDAFHGALGDIGLAGEIEHGTGTGLADLQKQLGGEDNYARWANHKVNQHAAAHYADRELSLMADDVRPRPFTQESTSVLRQFAHKAWSEPDVMAAAIKEMAANPGELAVRIRREITNSHVSPDAYLANDGKAFMTAVNHFREAVLPNAEHLVGAATDETGAVDVTKIGLARTTTLDQPQAMKAISKLVTEARRVALGRDADVTYADAVKLEGDVNSFLHDNFGVDARHMPHDIDEKLTRAQDFARHLASRLFVANDAPAEVKAAVQRLHDLGYKPVAGTDIGWLFKDLGGPTTNNVVDGALTRRRRLIEWAGLSPENYSSMSISQWRRTGIRSAIQAEVDAGKVKLPPHYTVDTLLADLADPAVMQRPVPFGENVAMAAFRRFHEPAIQAAMTRGATRGEAELAMRNELLSALQLRDLPRSQVMKVLTRTDNYAPETLTAMEEASGVGAGATLGLPLLDTASAERVYRAIVKGSAAPPAYMLGASRLEDLARAKMGFAGEVVPGRLGESIANLPNEAIALTKRLRFNMSPSFSFRRIAKTIAKLRIEGVDAPLNPLARMLSEGSFDQAMTHLDRVLPNASARIADDADRYLYSQDVFGLYNARHYEAYAVKEWAKAGLDDEAIKQKLTKTFGYGTRQAEGRSALERTTNFMFFPFSFDKTLYRNFGGYLLDHPAQQILLTNGLRAYKEFNDRHLDGTNPLAASWFEQHVPLLQEALRLNAFAHGISAGEFGGVNRPLLNLFLPQNWDATAPNSKTLQRFIPAVKDFNRVLTESKEQFGIAKTAAFNAIDATTRSLSDNPRSPLNPRPAAMTTQAQLQGAFNMRVGLVTSLKDSLDWNAGHHDKAAQYKFPADATYGDLAGEPINKTNIGRLVKRFYPAFNPDSGLTFAVAQKSRLEDYRLSLKGTDKFVPYNNFIEQATKAANYLNDDKYPAAQAAEVTAEFRRAALAMAETDPKFLKIYDRHFSYYFGPLQAVR